MRELFLIASAGALGAMSRYGVGFWTEKRFGHTFPYGTLTVNVLGSLIIGIVIYIASAHMISRDLRLFITTGFLGAFTTFSSFSYDTVKLFQEGSHGLAFLNVGMNLVLGIGAAFAGVLIGRVIVGT